MARKARVISLTDNEKSELEAIVRKATSEQRMVVRAKIILLTDKGLKNKDISKKLGVSKPTVVTWRKRYGEFGIMGLRDLQRPGRSQIYDMEERIKVISEACRPPEITTHWTIRDLQKRMRERWSINMSHMTIQRILSSADLKPHQYEMWLNSTDPDFEAKQADVVGLYMNPPENAMVICIDERTGMQALGRKHPNKSMRPGKPEKMEFEYKRYGTKSLIAALIVHEGRVLGKCYDRHTNKEFLDFLQTIEDKHPKQELHIIVDNLSVHKHANVKKWLEERKDRIKFHFTPTHASWLNQIELWFSILSRKVLKRGIFNSRQELVDKVLGFIEKYNREATPFRWTYTGNPLKI